MRLPGLVLTLSLAVSSVSTSAIASVQTAREYFTARVQFEQNRRALQRAIRHLLSSLGLRLKGRPNFFFNSSRDVVAFVRLRDGRGCQISGDLTDDGEAETSTPICSIE